MVSAKKEKKKESKVIKNIFVVPKHALLLRLPKILLRLQDSQPDPFLGELKLQGVLFQPSDLDEHLLELGLFFFATGVLGSTHESSPMRRLTGGASEPVTNEGIGFRVG